MAQSVPLVRTRKKCPKCKKGTLDSRKSRGFLVKTLLFWLPIKRYKCGMCGKKTYIYGSAWSLQPKPVQEEAIA